MGGNFRIRAGAGLLLAMLWLSSSAASLTAQIPAPSPATTAAQTDQNANPLSLDEAQRLALAQASNFQEAVLNERIAAEDVKQAQAAFLPKVSAPLSYIY